METPKERILMIMDRLGMSQTVAANAMNMPINTFRKNKMDTLKYNNFTEKNHSDLVDFLINEIQFLATYKRSINAEVNSYENSINKIRDIYKNYHKYRRLDDWNLFDELKNVVDFMEEPSVFSDIELYTKTIDDIVFESKMLKNEPNIFTIDKYNDYVLCDKKNDHTRWFDYMISRRQKTIMDILRD